MPTYRFKNNETGEEWEKFMSISAGETFLEDNPHCSKMLFAMNIVGGTGDAVKPKELQPRIHILPWQTHTVRKTLRL